MLFIHVYNIIFFLEIAVISIFKIYILLNIRFIIKQIIFPNESILYFRKALRNTNILYKTVVYIIMLGKG